MWKILGETFFIAFDNLQRLPVFLFVAAFKAGPVHSAVHGVELWRERAAKSVKVIKTGVNKLLISSSLKTI